MLVVHPRAYLWCHVALIGWLVAHPRAYLWCHVALIGWLQEFPLVRYRAARGGLPNVAQRVAEATLDRMRAIQVQPLVSTLICIIR